MRAHEQNIGDCCGLFVFLGSYCEHLRNSTIKHGEKNNLLSPALVSMGILQLMVLVSIVTGL